MIAAVTNLLTGTPLERAEREHAAATADLQAAREKYGDEPTTTNARTWQAAKDRVELAGIVLDKERAKQAAADAKKAEAERAAAEAELRELVAANTLDARLVVAEPHIAKILSALETIGDELQALDELDDSTCANLRRALEIETRAKVQLVPRSGFGDVQAPDVVVPVASRARRTAYERFSELRRRKGEAWVRHVMSAVSGAANELR